MIYAAVFEIQIGAKILIHDVFLGAAGLARYGLDAQAGLQGLAELLIAERKSRSRRFSELLSPMPPTKQRTLPF